MEGGGLNAQRDCEWRAETIRPRRFPHGNAVTRRDETGRIDRRHCRDERERRIRTLGGDEAGHRLCAVVAQAARGRQFLRCTTMLVACSMVGRRIVVRGVSSRACGIEGDIPFDSHVS